VNLRTHEEREWVTDRRIAGYNAGRSAVGEAIRTNADNLPAPPKSDPFYREGFALAVSQYGRARMPDVVAFRTMVAGDIGVPA
jgi:hypothetical protein